MTALLDAQYLAAIQTGAPSIDLGTRAMLVDLTIRKWGNTRQDQQVRENIAAQYGSNAKLGKFSKNLVDPEKLAPVNSKLGAIYLEHRRRTLPWLDSGPRILSAAGYFEYTEFLRTARLELDDLLADVGANYMTWVQDAARTITGLGGLFDPTLYPPQSEILDHYEIRSTVLPLPAANDFRVELGDAELSRVREQIASGMESVIRTATRDVYDRVSSTVGKMAEKLTGYDGGKSGAFRDSLIENVRDLADVLPSLNLTGDPALDAICDRIRRELCTADPDVLRKDETTRLDVAKSADEIMAQMQAFVA